MFYNQLCALCSQKGTTPTAFVTNVLNLSSSKVTAWKGGSIPKYGTLEKISNYFGVPISFLFEDANEPVLKSSTLSDDEQELLSNYRKSSRIDKARIQERALVSAEHAAEHRSEPRITTIKLFDSAASAGTGIYVDYTGYENIETEEDTVGADYAVRVSGDSMEPRFHDGDIVLVELAQTVEVGEVGIFNLNGQAYIKQRGEKSLISLNSDYKPIVINSGDDLVCQGRVIKVLSMPKGA